uniref:Zinc finger protein 58 n=1 Tax=Cacopsylla melanoneura TaxID=428564 RepID=A0A8D9FGW3_9HEMI
MFCHKGQRPIKCEVCGIGLLSKSHLSEHRILHTGIKPFACDKCGTRFAKKWNLKVHRKKLHGLDDIISEKIVPGDAKLHTMDDVTEKSVPGGGKCEEKPAPAVVVEETVRPAVQNEQPSPYKCTLCPFYSMQKTLLEQHWVQEHSRYNLAAAAYSSYDQFNILNPIPPS